MIDTILVAGFFVLGSIFASFIGVLSERLYTGGSWKRGRSSCNSCGRPLEVLDLIPILSWICFSGVCRTCACRIPMQYAISEILLGFLCALSYRTLGLTPALVVFLAALFVLAFIVLYDLRHTVVPFGASVLLIALSLVFSLLTSVSIPDFGLKLFVAGCIGLFFFVLFAASRGRAMGLGDAPVGLSLSLLAGKAAIAGLLFSFWIGALIGILLLFRRPAGSRMGVEVAFVPFLAAGFLLAYFTQWNPLPLVF